MISNRVPLYPTRNRNDFTIEGCNADFLEGIVQNERKIYSPPILQWSFQFERLLLSHTDLIQKITAKVLIMTLRGRPSLILRCFKKVNCEEFHVGSLHLPEIPIQGPLDSNCVRSVGCQLYFFPDEGGLLVAVSQSPVPSDRANIWVRTLLQSVSAELVIVVDELPQPGLEQPSSLVTTAFRSHPCLEDVESLCPPLMPPFMVTGASAAVLSYCERRSVQCIAVVLPFQDFPPLLLKTFQQLLCCLSILHLGEAQVNEQLLEGDNNKQNNNNIYV